MKIRFFGWGLVFLWVAGSALSAQSLVEAARKEKERRESIQGQAAVKVTNEDLAKVIKKPAFVSGKTEPPLREGEEGEDAPPIEEAQFTVPPPDKLASQAAQAAEAVMSYETRKAELQARLTQVLERQEFLNLKMRALQQQLYSFNTMVSKERTQQEIAETFLKLQEADAEAAAAKSDLDLHLAQTPPRARIK